MWELCCRLTLIHLRNFKRLIQGHLYAWRRTVGVHSKAKHIDIWGFCSPQYLRYPTFQRCGSSATHVPMSGGKERLYGETRQKTLVRLCLTDILIQPAVHESEFSDHRDGNAAVEAVLKLSDAETCAGGILWRLGAKGASTETRTVYARLCLQRIWGWEKTSLITSARSRTLDCVVPVWGLHLPNPIGHATLPLCVRARVRMCLCLRKTTACWCAQTGSAGKHQAESTMARFCNVSQESLIKITCTSK